MLTHRKQFARWSALALYTLALAVLLVACGDAGVGGTTSTPTPTSPPASPTTATAAMTTFQGSGFTISYPQNWQTARQGDNLFTFTDSTGNLKMTITVAPDPNGTISADSVTSTALQAARALLKNSQTVSVPSTTTIAGETWSQQSASGTQQVNNQNTDIQVVVLADVHPANALESKSYTIVYQAPVSTFAQANTTYFQPMLQSFKFA